MASERTRLLVAGSVLLVGGGVLVKSYLQSRPPHARTGEVKHEITQEVRDALDDSRFVEFGEDEQSNVIDQIRTSVLSQARGISQVQRLGGRSSHDLADAFAERVLSMYWPEFERDFETSQSRGDPKPREDALEQFEQRRAFLETQDWGPKVVFEGVDVSLIQVGADGELSVQRERFAAGFGVLTSRRTMHLFPVPDDPVQDGLVSVEIVMPMYQYEVKSESMKPAVVGFRFAWNSSLNKWIPYESVLFKAPGEIFGAPAI